MRVPPRFLTHVGESPLTVSVTIVIHEVADNRELRAPAASETTSSQLVQQQRGDRPGTVTQDWCRSLYAVNDRQNGKSEHSGKLGWSWGAILSLL